MRRVLATLLLAPALLRAQEPTVTIHAAGAPTCVSGGCANATLTFCALALRSAAEIGKAFPKQ